MKGAINANLLFKWRREHVRAMAQMDSAATTLLPVCVIPNADPTLLPAVFDRKSRREREMFEQLAEQVGQLLFPGLVAKRDSYARAASEGMPVWQMKGAAAREAGQEVRAVLARVGERLGLAP